MCIYNYPRYVSRECISTLPPLQSDRHKIEEHEKHKFEPCLPLPAVTMQREESMHVILSETNVSRRDNKMAALDVLATSNKKDFIEIKKM